MSATGNGKEDAPRPDVVWGDPVVGSGPVKRGDPKAWMLKVLDSIADEQARETGKTDFAGYRAGFMDAINRMRKAVGGDAAVPSMHLIGADWDALPEEDRSALVGLMRSALDRMRKEDLQEAGWVVPRPVLGCDGSGGFGPPKGSGLLGWRACPGCPKCKTTAEAPDARPDGASRPTPKEAGS